MKSKVELKGANSRNRTYYSNLYPQAAEVIISDYCPNRAFQRPELCGYRKASKEDSAAKFAGMKVWHRRSTSMGAHKVYVSLN